MSVLRELAEELGWRFLGDDELPSREHSLVIVAPIWSAKDHRILRDLATRLPDHLDVFLVDCDSLLGDRYEAVFPGDPALSQTPAIYLYRDDRLLEFVEGPIAVLDSFRP